jgi:hypothetical protein
MEEDDIVPGPDPEGAKAAEAKTEDTAASEEDEDGDGTAAEGTEDDSEGEGEDQPKPKGKPKGGFQKRIAELTANWRGAERDRDYWRQLAVQDKQGQQPRQQQQPDSKQPRQEDFQEYGAYLEARTEWIADQRVQQALHQERERNQRQVAQNRQRQTVQTYEGRLDAARSKYEDFDDVAFAPDVHVTNDMAHAILDSDHGPDIQYYLGSHPDEAQRIARLSPHGQVRELGKLEAKLSAPPTKKTSQAPPPVKPVGGRGANAGKIDPDKLPIGEWMALANEGKLKY